MEFVKKNIIAILCVISLVALVFTFGEITVSSSLNGESTGNAASSFGGFSAIGTTIFGYFLIIGPVALIAMNYVKQLEEKKGLLAVAVPVLCIVAWILVVMGADSIAAAGSAAAAGASVKTEVSLSFGAYLALISYIATGIAGALTFHGAKVKALKEKGESFVKKSK